MSTSSQIDRIRTRSAQVIQHEMLIRRAPFIVTDVLTEWKASSLWSFSYLGERIGDRRVKVAIARGRTFHYGSKGPQQTRTREMAFRDAVRRIASQDRDSPEHLYIMEQQHEGSPRWLPEVYPELAADYALPPSVNRAKLLQINLWLGAAGNVTPLHFDMANNFLAQINGRKRITFFDPAQTDRLYPAGSRSSSANTSQVDILRPDFEKHPRFKEATPLECVLSPGELLYIPPFWWHQVESVDAAVSINFWWQPRFVQCLHPMGILSIYSHHDRGALADFSAVDIDEFSNLAQVAAYCLDAGHKCAAVLFAKAELERRHDHDRASVARAIGPWRDLLLTAEMGDDNQLNHEQVAWVLSNLDTPPPATSEADQSLGPLHPAR